MAEETKMLMLNCQSIFKKKTVAAVYSEDCQVYIGKVLEVDEDDTLISLIHHGNSKRLDSNSVLKVDMKRKLLFSHVKVDKNQK